MPFTADSIAAQQVQECLKSLYGLVHEIEKKRFQSEHGINAINKYHNNHEGQHFQVILNLRCNYFILLCK